MSIDVIRSFKAAMKPPEPKTTMTNVERRREPATYLNNFFNMSLGRNQAKESMDPPNARNAFLAMVVTSVNTAKGRNKTNQALFLPEGRTNR
jgi:hypothetical protein